MWRVRICVSRRPPLCLPVAAGPGPSIPLTTQGVIDKDCQSGFVRRPPLDEILFLILLNTHEFMLQEAPLDDILLLTLLRSHEFMLQEAP